MKTHVFTVVHMLRQVPEAKPFLIKKGIAIMKNASLLPVRGLHGPDFSVQARPGPHSYDLGPARPEAKKKVSARARPGP